MKKVFAIALLIAVIAAAVLCGMYFRNKHDDAEAQKYLDQYISSYKETAVLQNENSKG